VSIKLADGKVGLLPTMNSLGTISGSLGNGTNNQGYWSEDGSVALTPSFGAHSGGDSRVCTITGVYRSGANPPTQATGTTVTFPAPRTGSPNIFGDMFQFHAVNNNQFIVMIGTNQATSGGTQYIRTTISIVTCDTSGNLSKGNVITQSGTGNSSQYPSYATYDSGKLAQGGFVAWYQRMVKANQESGNTKFGSFDGVFKASGTTLSFTADSNAVYQYANNASGRGNNGKSTKYNMPSWHTAGFGTDWNNFSLQIGSVILRNSPNENNTTRGTKDNTWVGVSSFNTTTGAVGSSISHQNFFTSSTVPNWNGSAPTHSVIDRTHIMSRYMHTNGTQVGYVTWLVNSSGVLSKAHEKLVTKDTVQDIRTMYRIYFPKRNSTAGAQTAVYLTDIPGGGTRIPNSMSLSATGEILGFNVGLGWAAGIAANTQAHDYQEHPNYNGDANWTININQGGAQKAVRFTVNAAVTTPYTHVGFPKASSSSGDQVIVVAGIATGFTGLTAGAKYWYGSGFTGALSTTDGSGDFGYVGQALSATTILLNRGQV